METYRRKTLSTTAAAILLLSCGSAAMAQTTFFWDPDGNATSFLGGNGTWNTSSSFWRSGSQTGTLGTWTSASNNNAVFTGTPGTVTLGGNITLNQLRLLSTGYTVAPGVGTTITLGGSAGTTGITALGSHTVSSILAGTNGLFVGGPGTVTLQGANTFTGNLTVSGASLVLDLAGQNNTIASQNVTLGTSSASNGATLAVVAPDAVTRSQTVGNITYWSNSRLVASGSNTTLTTGNIVRGGAGTQLLFDVSGAGRIAIGGTLNGSSATDTFISQYLAITDGVGRGDIAVKSSDGFAARLNATSLLSAAGSGSTLGDYLVNSGTTTLSANQTAVRTIRIDASSAPATLNVNGGFTTASSNLNFVVESGAAGNNVSINTTNATNFLNNTAANTQVVFWTFGSGATTVNSRLAVNNTSGQASQTLKFGDGLLIVAAAQLDTPSNTRGDFYRIFDGVLRQSNTLGLTNGVLVGTGGIFEIGAANINTTSGNPVDYNGLISFNGGGGGISAWTAGGGGSRTVTLQQSNNTSSGPVAVNPTMTWASSGGFAGSTDRLILGSQFSNATVILTNSINLNNDIREIRVNNGVFSDDVDGELSGAITSTTAASGGILKTGTGTLALTGANTFTGGLTIAEGRVNIGNGGTAGSIATNVTNNGVLGFNRSDDFSYAGVITGNGSVRQIGTGTTTLSGNHTYTGTTQVNAGTLLVNGSLAAASAVTVGADGTLGGTGTVGGSTTINGAIAPGANNIGTLETGALSLNANSTLRLELNIVSASLVTFDTLNVTGNLSLAGANLNLANLGSSTPLTLGTVIPFLTYTGVWNGGTFAGFANNSTFSAFNNQFRINYGTGSNSVITLEVVPEPSTALLLLGALGGLFAMRRFRSRSA